MKTRTVVLEVEVEGPLADPLRLRDRIEDHLEASGWRVRRAEVLEERQP